MPGIDSDKVFAPHQKDLEYKAYYLLAGLSEHLAEQFKLIRESQGLSQKQLADILQTQQSLVSRLENPAYARYNLLTIAKLAVALNSDLSIQVTPKAAAIEYAASNNVIKFCPKDGGERHQSQSSTSFKIEVA